MADSPKKSKPIKAEKASASAIRKSLGVGKSHREIGRHAVRQAEITVK